MLKTHFISIQRAFFVQVNLDNALLLGGWGGDACVLCVCPRCVELVLLVLFVCGTLLTKLIETFL